MQIRSVQLTLFFPSPFSKMSFPTDQQAISIFIQILCIHKAIYLNGFSILFYLYSIYVLG